MLQSNQLTSLVQRGDCSHLSCMPRNLANLYEEQPWHLLEENIPADDKLKKKAILEKFMIDLSDAKEKAVQKKDNDQGEEELCVDHPFPRHWLADPDAVNFSNNEKPIRFFGKKTSPRIVFVYKSEGACSLFLHKIRKRIPRKPTDVPDGAYAD